MNYCLARFGLVVMKTTLSQPLWSSPVLTTTGANRVTSPATPQDPLQSARLGCAAKPIYRELHASWVKKSVLVGLALGASKRTNGYSSKVDVVTIPHVG